MMVTRGQMSVASNQSSSFHASRYKSLILLDFSMQLLQLENGRKDNGGEKQVFLCPKAVVQNYVFIGCGELQLFTPAFQTYLQKQRCDRLLALV